MSLKKLLTKSRIFILNPDIFLKYIKIATPHCTDRQPAKPNIPRITPSHWPVPPVAAQRRPLKQRFYEGPSLPAARSEPAQTQDLPSANYFTSGWGATRRCIDAPPL